MLRIEQLCAGYGQFQALFGVGLRLEQGETIALIGANGAGKTTLLRCMAGAIRPRSGTIAVGERDTAGRDELHQLRLGIALVPEGRKLFPTLTVRENLELAQRASRGRKLNWSVESLFDELPALAALQGRPSTALSGGQQQLVAIARALATNPDYLLCDEISLGLSPAAVDEVYGLLARARQRTRLAVLLVEQNVARALGESQRFYCIQKGRIVLEGRSAEADHAQVAHAYFGV